MTAQAPVVMVVDDSRLARESLARILEEAGYPAPMAVASGSEALERLVMVSYNGSPPDVDLIITDIVMEGMSGIEVCLRVKRDVRLADIPVIMITAKEDMVSLREAFAAGANDYLTKPINKIEMLARVRSALALKMETDRRRAREAKLRRLAIRLATLNRKLRAWSNQDGLTGVANRRFWNDLLEREWSRALRHGRSLAVIMVDIDHFKAYNDHLGHLAGDDCLRQVARALAGGVRRGSDLLARFGGEEFCALLPETSAQEALSLAEMLRKAVEGLGLAHPESSVGPMVTVSLGVATAVPENDDQATDLVKKADLALYQAKQRGRNQCRLHGAGD